jgi:hypothetical protein
MISTPMEALMSARVMILATLLALTACGGPEIDPKAPQTATERARLEAEENGELPPKGKNWGGWRYQGDRKDCFFTVGRKCFKTETAACAAAKCGKATKCMSNGAGPATISCK